MKKQDDGTITFIEVVHAHRGGRVPADIYVMGGEAKARQPDESGVRRSQYVQRMAPLQEIVR
ncbi:MAG: hypothetical protein QOF16_1321 [Actinomycetota bacterium]|jgi:hypothetical protein|nr:hypothetical protein [Actinomycetota bacterium]